MARLAHRKPVFVKPVFVKPVFVKTANTVFATAVFAFVAALLMTGAAAAQDRRQNQLGKFDFYVLSLSWAPSFCDAAFERAPDQAPPPECATRAIPVRGSRPVAVMRKGLSGILPAAGATA